MKRETCKKMTAEMIDEAAESMKAKIDKALNCGALDLDYYGEDYELPKIILAALLEDAQDTWRPPFQESREEAKNLYQML